MEVPMRFWYAAVFACGLALLAAPQKSDKEQSSLQKAIQTETVDGDLKSAIEQYKKIAQSRDHSVAAKALLRMGECYERLGDAEARKAFERVVREFGDQKEEVEYQSRRAYLFARKP
jgi:tetratricopeptide (TPR) repeat protein